MIAAGIALAASNFLPHAIAITLPLCGTYLLMGVAYSSWLRGLNFGEHEDFSYGTYLYAYPVQQLIVKMAAGPFRRSCCFFIAAPISIGLGGLSWALVEWRFLRRGTNRNQGLTAGTVVNAEVELKEA